MYKKLRFTMKDGEELTSHYYSTASNDADIKKVLKAGYIEIQGVYYPVQNIRHFEIERNVGRPIK